jgi:hypothetical protein
VGIDKLLPNTCPIKNSLKWGDALSPMFFNSIVQYVIRRIEGAQDDRQCGCYIQLLVYTDDVNKLGEGKRTVDPNTRNLLVANREIILKVKDEESTYSCLMNILLDKITNIYVSEKFFESLKVSNVAEQS